MAGPRGGTDLAPRRGWVDHKLGVMSQGRIVADFSRFRLSTEPPRGPFPSGPPYEHALTLRRVGAGAGLNVGVGPGGGEWLASVVAPARVGIPVYPG